MDTIQGPTKYTHDRSNYDHREIWRNSAIKNMAVSVGISMRQNKPMANMVASLEKAWFHCSLLNASMKSPGRGLSQRAESYFELPALVSGPVRIWE